MGLFQRNGAKLTPYLQLLKGIPLFSKLTNQEFIILSQIIHERTYLKGEVIFEECDEGLGMYVVVEGRVQIHRNADGGQVKLSEIEPGAFFGELALLSGAPRSATAICLEPTRLLFFFRPEFMDVLETHGKMGSKLSIQIAIHTAERLRRVVLDRDFL
ncbi:MAG: cyclic nucleotide-binding domain-containing protein [Candidatus Methylacidiphilales bacterium]|nr:cyclic nucleotide-binding domain-containing protein [Candidatus Methylacidiphilales bacterium]